MDGRESGRKDGRTGVEEGGKFTQTKLQKNDTTIKCYLNNNNIQNVIIILRIFTDMIRVQNLKRKRINNRYKDDLGFLKDEK